MRHMLLSVVIGSCLAWAPAASANLTVTVTGSGSDPHSITGVQPGATITVTLVMDADQPLFTVEGDLTASASNVFDVTALSFASNWDQPGAFLALPSPFNPPMGLDPALHLGSGPSGLTPATGSLSFATVTLAVDAAAAAGQYTLQFNEIGATDEAYNTVPGTSGVALQVTIGTTGGGGGGGGGGGSGGGSGGTGGGTTPPPDSGGGSGSGSGGTPGDSGSGTPPADNGSATTDQSGSSNQSSATPGSGESSASPPSSSGSPTQSNSAPPPAVPAAPSPCGGGMVESSAVSLLMLATFAPAWRRRRQ